MKKIAVVLAMVLCFLCCAASAESVAGGWTLPEELTVTEEAKAALDKALEGFVGSGFEPVALIGTQVVAGINYCLLCKVTNVVPDAVPYLALVYVYANLEGGAEILATVDLNVGDIFTANLVDEEG